MNADLISIFDIPLLVDSICCALCSDDIVICRKVCKAWNAAFATREWRTVTVYKGMSDEDCDLIRDNSRWIRYLYVPQCEALLNDSLCTSLQRLSYNYIYDSADALNPGDSALALLRQNRRLTELELIFHKSHVRCHVLPNLPRLTNLQQIGRAHV